MLRNGCQAIPHGQLAFLRRGWSLMARPVPSPRDGLLDRWTGPASPASCGDEALHITRPVVYSHVSSTRLQRHYLFGMETQFKEWIVKDLS
jgi:hypothetical protein